jgi:hypothetical protein
MKKLIIQYAVNWLIEVLEDLAERTTNTIDDQVVYTLRENQKLIIQELEEQL